MDRDHRRENSRVRYTQIPPMSENTHPHHVCFIIRGLNLAPPSVSLTSFLIL